MRDRRSGTQSPAKMPTVKGSLGEVTHPALGRERAQAAPVLARECSVAVSLSQRGVRGVTPVDGSDAAGLRQRSGGGRAPTLPPGSGEDFDSGPSGGEGAAPIDAAPSQRGRFLPRRRAASWQAS